MLYQIHWKGHTFCFEQDHLKSVHKKSKALEHFWLLCSTQLQLWSTQTHAIQKGCVCITFLPLGIRERTNNTEFSLSHVVLQLTKNHQNHKFCFWSHVPGYRKPTFWSQTGSSAIQHNELRSTTHLG